MVAKSQRWFSLSVLVIAGICLMFSVFFLVSDIITIGFSSDSIASAISAIFFGLLVSLGWYLFEDRKYAKGLSLFLSWGAFGFSAISFLLTAITFIFTFSIGDEHAGDAVLAVLIILPIPFLLFLFYFYVLYLFYKDKNNKRNVVGDFFMMLGAFFALFVFLAFLTALFPEENDGKGELDDADIEDEVEFYPLELEEEIEEVESEADVDVEAAVGAEESVALSELFALLPEEYCDSNWREPVLIYDEENYFMKTGPDVTKGGAYPSYSYCEFAVFKNLVGGKDVYGVVYNTLTPMLPFSALWFFEYEDGALVDSAESVVSLVDFADLCEAGRISVEENKPDLIDQDLDCSYYVELPQYGTTINFYQYNTGEVIYQLKWNGAEFSVL